MFYWYGLQNQPRSNIRTFNKKLFGIDSRLINNILIPHNLHELVGNINLDSSKYFRSADAVIRNMTFINLYISFLRKSEQNKVIKSLMQNGPINITKSLLGLKDLKCKALDFRLKFCYECWSENHSIYFDIEHQVMDNNICYNHKTRLQYIIINSSDYFMFDNTCIAEYIEAPFCISEIDIYELLYSNFLNDTRYFY